MLTRVHLQVAALFIGNYSMNVENYIRRDLNQVLCCWFVLFCRFPHTTHVD